MLWKYLSSWSQRWIDRSPTPDWRASAATERAESRASKASSCGWVRVLFGFEWLVNDRVEDVQNLPLHLDGVRQIDSVVEDAHQPLSEG